MPSQFVNATYLFANNSLQLFHPSGVRASGVMLALVESKDGAAITPPAAWAQLDNTLLANNSLRVSLWRKTVRSADVGGSSTWLSSGAMGGFIVAYTTSPTALNQQSVDSEEDDPVSEILFPALPPLAGPKHRILLLSGRRSGGAAGAVNSQVGFTERVDQASGNLALAAIESDMLNAPVGGLLFTTTDPSGGGGGAAFLAKSHAVQPFGTDLTIPKPAGTVSGDLLLALVGVGFPGRGLEGTIPPAGWTELFDLDTHARLNFFGLPTPAIAWKVAGGAEPADYAWLPDFGAPISIRAVSSASGVDSTFVPNPAGMVVGDLLISLGSVSEGALNIASLGGNEIFNVSHSGGNSQAIGTWMVATQGQLDDGGLNFNGTGFISGTLIAIPTGKFNIFNPIDSFDTAEDDVDPVTCPGLTTTADGCLLLRFKTVGADTGVGNAGGNSSAPAGHTEQADEANGSCEHAVASQDALATPAGAQASADYSIGGVYAAPKGIGISIAITPSGVEFGATGTILRFSGAHLTSPINAFAVNEIAAVVSQPINLSVVCPDIVTTEDGCLILRIDMTLFTEHFSVGTVSSIGPAAGYTEREDIEENIGSLIHLGAYTKNDPLTPAGATGTEMIVVSGDESGHGYGVTIAIAPGSGGGGGGGVNVVAYALAIGPATQSQGAWKAWQGEV